MTLSSKNIKWIIIFVLLAAAMWFLAFNDYGIIKYIKLKKEVTKLNQEIDQIAKENKGLENEIDSLKNKIPAKIEKTAREKYGMIKKGEQAIEVKQQ